MTAQEIENRIARVNATMSMEGMPLTEQEKQTMRDIGNGKANYEEVMQSIINKYKKDKSSRN